uniref:RING-type domain-containing protein n=1 Tax=Peronospora matthiolae TaxID=2874970 RepID=A0AAV1UDM4_9STRA
MFLRSLYGSRMPQALHPRVDPQASSYWEEDTVSSQAIARAMEEEADEVSAGADTEGKKQKIGAVALVGDTHDSRRYSVRGLPSQLTALLGRDGMALEDVVGLRVEDMGSSPVNSNLSPAGLISIAAADIDEAATNSSQHVPPVNGELDLAFIRSLRQSSGGEAGAGPTSRNVLHVANTALTQLLGSAPASCGLLCHESGEAPENESKLFSLVRRHFNMLKASSSLLARACETNHDDATEGQGKLRFLSLLRRINELRSQQVDTESWDGLPYPQIITLPTFKYRPREQLADGNQSGDDGEVSNTVCAVCCDGFEAGEEVRALPCLHFYHRECIDQWLMCHRQCPICKHVVSVY